MFLNIVLLDGTSIAAIRTHLSLRSNFNVPNNYHIIIAEDDIQLLRFLERMVLKCYPSAAVYTFTNGLEVLQQFQQHGADLLITNHSMPGMNGPTLIRTLRAQQITISIVGISGDQTNADECDKAGVTIFLASPFSPMTFQQEVYKLLEP